MTVAVLLVTHEGVGEVILRSVTRMLEMCPLQTDSINVPFDCDLDLTLTRAEQAMDRLDSGQGVLILTDLCGATPSNIAHRLSGKHQVEIITGLNLPMLMRVMNYPALDLKMLALKAISGGREGVMVLTPKD